jgi:sugar lactone lactonase YvrE
VTQTLEALAVEAPASCLGEGPLWHAGKRTLFWTDIDRQRLCSYDPSAGTSCTFEFEFKIGAFAMTPEGRMVLATPRGFMTCDENGKDVSLIAEIEVDRPETRMNDGKCDRAGRFWAGTMAYDDSRGSCSLYRLDPDGSTSRMLGGVTISNGLAWSGDDTLMYYVDTAEQRIDVFDFELETGAIAGRRPFVYISPAVGRPDGITIDADDHVWVALWGGGSVHRYSPDGDLHTVISVPASLVTSCAFGGESLEDLYITTATVALNRSELDSQPDAGRPFTCRPGVPGLPAATFGSSSTQPS